MTYYLINRISPAVNNLWDKLETMAPGHQFFVIKKKYNNFLYSHNPMYDPGMILVGEMAY